ncbi:DUF6344 domain-containing protein [Streptomyces sp. CC228A]|uniref:DUF6344 domain-containing protein n=1 Tax=Streptomyces sp. CC228A TaxID=2898186 RepID=UPI001F2C1D0E|nr:DUF6344 domain-containing protein [Streptomyces sp. CC228A]
MAAVMVKQFRTAIVSLLRALLALFGLRPSPAAGGRTAVAAAPARPAVPAQRAVQTGGAAGRDCGAVRAGALPPTMKQRIRAEAHGASPAVRRSPADPVAALSSPAVLTACAAAPAAPAGSPAAAVSSARSGAAEARAAQTRPVHGVPAPAVAGAAAPLSGGAAAL